MKVHPPFTTDAWGYFEHPRVSEYSAIQILHNIKRSSNDSNILTKCIWYRNWDNLPGLGARLGIVLVEGTQHSIFALDLVSGRRE